MERELPNLPDEIIFNILSRLPVKPLCRFKSVSKPWLALITDTHFIKSQLNLQSSKGNQSQKLILTTSTPQSVYSVDYQAPDHNVAELEMPCKCKSVIGIMGSCNGVILLGIDYELCLWNPSIRMYRKFSQPANQRGTGRYGLGYDSVSDDFKVVSVVFHSSRAPGDVYVFTSKHSSWKWIGDTHYIYKSYHGRVGTVVNGMPHWLWIRSSDGSFMGSSVSKVILCFDATEEKFKEVPQPNYESGYISIDMGIFGEWLCVVHEHHSRYDVWVMKEFGVKESWTKLFVVPSDFYSFKPLCYAKDEEVLMMSGWDELVIYDPKEFRYTRIGIPQGLFDMDLYVESLFSPHGGTTTAN